MSSKNERPTDASRLKAGELLNTDIATTYSLIHPIFVTALFYRSFGALVADPVSTLISTAPPLCFLQAIYMILCVPPFQNARPIGATSPASGSRGSQSPSSRRKQPLSLSSVVGSRIIPTIISLLITIAIAPPFFTVILILHGAPITTHLPQTFLCALHMSLLSVSPLFYAHGISSAKWIELIGLLGPIDEVIGAAMGTFVGTWAGAIPIPLDWDREWQKWPVTLVTGAYIGWAVGKLLGATVLKNTIVQFVEKPRGRSQATGSPSLVPPRSSSESS